MINKILVLLTLALGVFLVSCDKDNIEPSQENSNGGGVIPPPAVPDTIFPLPYFPAYPGSYWNYSDGSTRSVDSGYHIANYTNNWPSYIGEPANYTQVYLPRYRFTDSGGETTRDVYGYSFLPHDPGGSNNEPDVFYHENAALNSWWDVSTIGGYCWSYEVVTKDTSMLINGVMIDSIDVVRSFASCFPNHPATLNPEYWGDPKYYAKDIGLVRYDVRNTADSVLTVTEMTDYFINN